MLEMSLLLIEFMQKLFEIRPSMFSAQLRTLWNRSTNWSSGLNLNISINTREYFRLTNFWATLYIVSTLTMQFKDLKDDYLRRTDILQ
jgi:hypothetical protein